MYSVGCLDDCCLNRGFSGLSDCRDFGDGWVGLERAARECNVDDVIVGHETVLRAESQVLPCRFVNT